MSSRVLLFEGASPVVLQTLQPVAIGGLAVLGLVLVVAVAVFGKRLIGSDSTAERAPDHQHQATETEPEPSSETGTTAGTAAVDEATLRRLEAVVPEAVDTVRRRSGGTGSEQPEQRLYAAIEVAIDDGTFDMGHTSVYGDRYEIVNLPSHLRDIDLTQFSGQYHVKKVEGQVREWIVDDDVSLRDLSIALEELTEHRDAITDYIRSRESEFEGVVDDITEALDDVTAIAEQIDGQVGERFRMLVVENRHAQVTGVTGIRSGIDDAKVELHQCAFDEASRQIRDCKQDSEALLTAVDFFRSFIGGIEHGQQSAHLPNEAATQLSLQLTDLLEQQYDVEITKQGDRLVVTGDVIDSGTERSVQETTEETVSAGTTESADNIRRVQPEEITDEILYIFRDLKRKDASGNTIEIQTEQLPESIARPPILQELETFCRRRSDVVDAVTLQDGAPPGFLEIRFVETTTVDAGLDTLADGFADRYASDS